MDQTKIMLRKYPWLNNHTVALFPESMGTANHSDAVLTVNEYGTYETTSYRETMLDTRPANEEECARLIEKLISEGYTPEFVPRRTPAMKRMAMIKGLTY